jgi:uncharacterized protein YbgA (DUF1722 family)/uncharacterized protein YbbK (DUF523 family)
VRYNAETNRPNAYVREICTHFDTQAFCPEMGIGLGVPRPPIRLVGSAQAVRIVDVKTHSHDYTDQIRAYAQQVLELAPRLCGYVLVKGSPSCGYGRVKRYSPEGQHLASDQNGIFAAALATADPLLPLEDDGRLNDPGLRESFVTRACAYHDWKTLLEKGLTAHRLIEFYTRYKYLVMAHHVPAYKSLGPMLADAGRQPLHELAATFISTLMAALTRRATRRSHSNVLFHLAGYLKQRINAEQRRRLSVLIEDYRTGKIPLIVPITMLKHHFADHPNAYIDGQVFLDPFPGELQVRNLV